MAFVFADVFLQTFELSWKNWWFTLHLHSPDEIELVSICLFEEIKDFELLVDCCVMKRIPFECVVLHQFVQAESFLFNINRDYKIKTPHFKQILARDIMLHNQFIQLRNISLHQLP